ncbi:MAG: DUF1571 domain-containing protein [Isosphaeraceae bacterium]|nr:DUF1571 domain-containing protein [Isosphaeraceae bacterium]
MEATGRSPLPISLLRRYWRAFLLVPLVLAALLLGLSWSLTAPLEDHPAPLSAAGLATPPVPLTPEEAALPGVPPAWPERRTDGDTAKKVLLATLIAVAEHLNDVDTYTATFKKQERLNGKLGVVQTLAMKVRHKPFAIYFKFLAPSPGKEVVYAEGHHENKVIAHSPGVAGWLVPRLAVPPNHPLALAESRHSVTEAGLANLTKKLIRFRELDLSDPEAVTILDRTTDDQGRPRLRSVHTHPHANADRPFCRVEVLYDPDSRIPVDIRNYEWPASGHGDVLSLAEHYRYEDLNLNADLSALDFDPANPEYAFRR